MYSFCMYCWSGVYFIMYLLHVTLGLIVTFMYKINSHDQWNSYVFDQGVCVWILSGLQPGRLIVLFQLLLLLLYIVICFFWSRRQLGSVLCHMNSLIAEYLAFLCMSKGSLKSRYVKVYPLVITLFITYDVFSPFSYALETTALQ